MRCFSLFVAWICLAAVYAQTPLLPFKNQQKWGFMDKSGSVRVAASYDFVKPFFNNGLAIVQRGKLLGLVDTNGTQRVPCEYELLDTTEQNATIWLARKQGNWALITCDNEVIMNNVTGKVIGINNDFVKIEHENGMGLLHLQRGLIADGDFVDFQIQPNGFIIATRDSVHCGLFSNTGRKILSPDYHSFSIIGKFVIAKQKYHWGLWDTLGNALLPVELERITALNDSIIYFTKRENQQLYNANSKRVIAEKIDTCQLFPRTNFICITRYDREGLIDGNGTIIIPTQFDDISIFNDSFFTVYQNNLAGLYNNQGDSLLPPNYTSFRTLGKAQLWGLLQNEKWGIYDLAQEKFLQPCTYRLLSNFNDDVLLAVAGDSTATINIDGVITWATVQRCTNPALNTNQLTFETGEKERTVLAFDENGYLVDSSRYTNFNKIQIKQRVDIVQGRPRLRNTVPDSLVISENLYWEFDNRRQIRKWGIRNATTGKWHFPPTYDRIRIFKEHGFTLAFIPGSIDFEMPLDRVNITFDCGLVFVNNQKGYPVTLPELLDVRVRDFDAGLNVARCVLSSGEHGLIAKNGRILTRGYRYIGEFRGGVARATKAGTLSISVPPIRSVYDVEHIDTFLPSFEAPYRTNGYASQKYLTDFWKFGQLICEGAKWGAIDTTGRLAVPFEYDFMRNFQNGSAAVFKNGKWGVINASNQILLKGEYGSVDFLPNSDNNLYKITRSDKKYGCIDTAARLVVPMEYDRVRAASENAIAVYKNGRWGFRHGDGSELAPCQYMDVHDFKEGLAGVFFKGRWGFINKYGRLTIQNTYPSVGDFSEGLAWVVVSGRKAGYIDTGGGLVISGEWASMSNFKNGMAVVRDRRGQIGIIDNKGSWLMFPTKKFNKIELLDIKGFARARIGAKYVLINTQGKILSQQYVTLRPFCNGFAAVRKRNPKQTWLPRNDRWGYIDTTGKLVGAIRYERLGDFHENRALFFDHNARGWGYIDTTGKTVIEPTFFEARPFENGRAIVFTKHNQSGLIDTTGNYTMQPRHNKIIDRSETMCVVRRGFEHYYYLSEDLKRLVPLVFQDAHPFADGVAGIKQNNFWGVINRQGVVVLTPKYQIMKNYTNGFAQVGIETRYGVANTKGEIIVQPEFEFVQYVGEGIFRVENGDFIGYIDSKGNWVKSN